MNGQLMPKEREFIYESVIESIPCIALEVGTWKGGGSTWQIVKALERNGMGILYTCETDKEFYDESYHLYCGSSQIKLHHQESKLLIDEMIKDNNIPDFLFFDGPEDEETALQDFITLDPFLKSGCIFMMHDFDPPSIKASKLRPFLENLNTWKIQSILSSPDSVGLVKAIKL